MTHTN